MLIKLVILYMNRVAIPYFKKDKVHIYNDMVNTYAQQLNKNSSKI